MRDKIKPYKFQIILFVLLAIFLAVTIGHIIQVGWDEFLKEFGNNDRPFSIRNIAIGIAALATAIFTWWKNTISKQQVEVSQRQTEEQIKQTQNLIRQTDNAQKQTENLIEQTKNAQRQIELQEDTRLDSLFAKAVEFLNEKNDLLTRKGGVHILKDLAITSPKHTQKCIDMLCSLNQTWMPYVLNENIEFFVDEYFNWTNRNITQEDLKHIHVFNKNDAKLPERILLSQDVNRHLISIINSISLNALPEQYDFSFKYLCSINLTDINFENFKLNNAFLVGANLTGCNFALGDLTGVNLQLATIIRCDFKRAMLVKSTLSGAKFVKTEFQCAFLNESTMHGTLFYDSNLQCSAFMDSEILGANLTKSNFQGANFTFAKIQASDLSESNFQGASFRNSFLNSTIMIDTALKGSEIKLLIKEPPTILSNNNLFDSFEPFEKNLNDFNEWLKSETKQKFSSCEEEFVEDFEDSMVRAFYRYKINKEVDFSDSLNLLEEPNEEFFSYRNGIAYDHIYSTITMLRFGLGRKSEKLYKLIQQNLIDFLVTETKFYQHQQSKAYNPPL